MNDKPMGWETFALLVLQIGLPAAIAIFEKWMAQTPPTPADFAELRAMASQKASDRAKSVLAAAGIPLDSAQAKEVLALVQS